MARRRSAPPPELPPGFSPTLLKELHLLTRDGQLNADARRKLKQIQHLVQLLRPALDDLAARHDAITLIDCGAGKSALGFLLYELVLQGPADGPNPFAGATLHAIESRPELVAAARARRDRFGYERLRFLDTSIEDAPLPERIHLVTALHACDTATDDALAMAILGDVDHVAVVPCCQAEVARQLDKTATAPGAAELFRHPWHRREFGSHLTNVLRASILQACGYQVTVTELAGWEHTLKNELILGKRIQRFDRAAQTRLGALLASFPGVEPKLLRTLRAQGRDPLEGSAPAP
jgi:hypothetical protein